VRRTTRARNSRRGKIAPRLQNEAKADRAKKKCEKTREFMVNFQEIAFNSAVFRSEIAILWRFNRPAIAPGFFMTFSSSGSSTYIGPKRFA
jgi:hypothetical protein